MEAEFQHRAPEQELQLSCEASTQGVAKKDFVRRLVAAELERARLEKKARALATLDRWIAEAEATPLEEREKADAEWREAMRDLDEHRSSPRKLFPELACDNSDLTPAEAA